jgi:hypothetical protein
MHEKGVKAVGLRDDVHQLADRQRIVIIAFQNVLDNALEYLDLFLHDSLHRKGLPMGTITVNADKT